MAGEQEFRQAENRREFLAADIFWYHAFRRRPCNHLPRVPAISTAPSEIGVYRLVEKIGEGGMGAVWKAVHTKLKKTVALKVLPRELTHDPDTIARFEREMEAVGALDHPNIVRAMDAGEFEGTHYLVMEYVEGTDLGTLVRARGRRSVRDACELVRQAAVGLAHAHEHGLVHRDIKPNNLLLSKQGKVKILDLGLARLMHDPSHPGNQKQLTSNGYILGTPDFMSPEQWDDTHAVDHRTDLYALGCTLFFLLTGRAPFEDPAHKTLPKKMAGHTLDAPPDLASVRDDVPLELNNLYLRLMAKNPDDRLSTAAELARELNAIVKGTEAKAGEGSRALGTEKLARSGVQPVSGRPVREVPDETLAERNSPSAPPLQRRRRMPMGIAAVCAVALILVVAFHGPFGRRNEPAARTPSEKAPGLQTSTAASSVSGEPATPPRVDSKPATVETKPGAVASKPATPGPFAQKEPGSFKTVKKFSERQADSSKLEIQDARFQTEQETTDLTERLRKAAKNGLLVVFVQPDLSPSNTGGDLLLRAKLGTEEIDQRYRNRMLVFLDARPPAEIPEKGLAILDALYGMGIWGEEGMVDVRKKLESNVRENKLRITVHEVAVGMPDPAFGKSKVLIVRYALDGKVRTEIFEEHETVRLNEKP